MTPYVCIERQIKRSNLNQLLALYAEKNSQLQKTAARIFMTLGELTKDDGLTLAEKYDALEDDCLALAKAIADRMTDPKHQDETELLFA